MPDDDRAPFNPVAGAFYLVAAVLAVYLIVVLMGVGFCMWHGDAIIEGKYKCDADSKLGELLAAALAAALAFAGGRMSKE